MPRIQIVGIAMLFDEDDQLVTSRDQLSLFDGYEYADERFTDYLGGTDSEDTLAQILHAGGSLQFKLDDDNPWYHAATEYHSSRMLTESELGLLLEYTIGQWDDGIGENIATETGIRHGLSLQCQSGNPKPFCCQTTTN